MEYVNPRYKDLKPRPRPEVCGECAGRRLVPHCPAERNANCPWSRCEQCSHVTGLVLGRPQHFQGPGPVVERET